MRKKIICILISLLIIIILFPVQGTQNYYSNNFKIKTMIPQNKCAYSEFGDDFEPGYYKNPDM